MKLRKYQQNLKDNVKSVIREGTKRILCQLATGGGKTYIFSNIVKSAINKGSRVLILTDRTELLTQAGGSLDSFDLLPEFIEAGEYPDLTGQLYIGMVETINRRMDRLEYIQFMQSLNLVIIDEAHMRNFTKLFQYFPKNTTVLGFTATPERQGRKKHLSDEYQSLVKGVSINYLIQNKFLAKPHYYGIEADLSNIKKRGGDYDQKQVGDMFSKDKVYIGVVENYERLTPNKKAIVFSSSIQSSEEVCNEFQHHGYKAKHLDGSMPTVEREMILDWFDKSTDGILCNVGVLTRGFDQPDIETVILYRATKSLPLYLQMIGRGSRTTPTKSDFTILDFGNNIREHGFWHKERKWTLDKPKKRKKKEEPAPIKECPNCAAIIPASARKCTECGYTFPVDEKKKEFVKLKELKCSDIKKEVKDASFEKLESIREAKGYKQGWVWRQIPIDKLQEYANWKGYSKGWVYYHKKQRNKESTTADLSLNNIKMRNTL